MMFRFFFTALFILLFCQIYSQNTFAETFFENHIQPVGHKLTDRTSVLTTMMGAFAVGLSEPNDQRIRSYSVGYQNMDQSTAHIGDLLGTGGVAVLSSGFQYAFDDREYVYQSHIRGLAYGGLFIYGLKTLFGRPRPGTSNNRQSFPSGHSTIAWMSATHLTYAYGWKAAVIAYPVATFVGASRLAADAHWFSDCVGGAFLGFIIGRATYYDTQDSANEPVENSVLKSKPSTDVQILPISVSPEYTAIQINVSF